MRAMNDILITLDSDLTNRQLKDRLERISREYSLAVIEGTETGRKYPEASDNIRFLNDLIFDLGCVIDNV